MKGFWEKAKQDPSVREMMVCLGLSMALAVYVGLGIALFSLVGCWAQAEAVKPKLVYTFTVTTWQPTTFSGIPFYVECEKENVDQWFRLWAKENGQYLKPEGKGFLQAYNIIWMSWPDDFKTKAKQTITFELWTSGPDKVGVKTVSLIADQMFSWNGDTPINPPEE